LTIFVLPTKARMTALQHGMAAGEFPQAQSPMQSMGIANTAADKTACMRRLFVVNHLAHGKPRVIQRAQSPPAKPILVRL
jgi:hypothetical protein